MLSQIPILKIGHARRAVFQFIIGHDCLIVHFYRINLALDDPYCAILQQPAGQGWLPSSSVQSCAEQQLQIVTRRRGEDYGNNLFILYSFSFVIVIFLSIPLCHSRKKKVIVICSNLVYLTYISSRCYFECSCENHTNRIQITHTKYF